MVFRTAGFQPAHEFAVYGTIFGTALFWTLQRFVK